MPFLRIKKPHYKKTLRLLRKKYDINRGELDRLSPHSPISYDPEIPEIPPYNRSSPINPHTGPNTRRNSLVSSQQTTPLINHTTGSRVSPVVRSPRGGRTRKQIRRSRGGRPRNRPLTRRSRRRRPSNSANSANENSDSEHSNATTPDIPYITHRL